MALDAATVEAAIKAAIVAPESPDADMVATFKTDFLAAVGEAMPDADTAAGSTWETIAGIIASGVIANIEGIVAGVAAGMVDQITTNAEVTIPVLDATGTADPTTPDGEGKFPVTSQTEETSATIA